MEQEIRHAMTYLKIQQIRFLNRLSVESGPHAVGVRISYGTAVILHRFWKTP